MIRFSVILTLVLASGSIAPWVRAEDNEKRAVPTLSAGASSKEAPPSETPSAGTAPSAPANGSDRSQPRERRWYGGAVIATDAAALALGLAGIEATGSRDVEGLAVPLMIAAGGAYLLGGPVVHGVHGRSGVALGSLGLRVGVPTGGAVVGALVGSTQDSGCTHMCGFGIVIGGIFGLGAGMVLASVLDISLLSYDSETGETPRVALVPSIDPKRDSAELNLVGVW